MISSTQPPVNLKDIKTSSKRLLASCLKMCHRSMLLLVLFVIGGGMFHTTEANDDIPFDNNYIVTWGDDHHVKPLNQGREIQLSLDKSNGSGFASKLSYGSGFFEMRIKLHNGDSAGVVTSFYLTSNTDKHDELDWEFLGNREGKPYTLQTNMYVNGIGGREQRQFLWFDPAADFHTYKILWNRYQIVFYVDDIPVRIVKNNHRHKNYPSQSMRIQSTLWNGDSWATDGGRTKINWNHGPFEAYYQGFNINGCPSPQGSNTQSCYSSQNWWNANKYSDLNPEEKNRLEEVKKKYMHYDYCTDKGRYPITPPECV